ncbi:MAG: glycosyltransferase family 39 protein [Anaerolineae bacterium]
MRVLASKRSTVVSPRLALLLILLLAWGLRLFHLGAMSIWWDESLSYDRAMQDLAGILAGIIRIQNVVTRDLHPPLYFLLLHFAVLAFGVAEFALRVLSTFANVLTVALMFPFVRFIARLGHLRHAQGLALLVTLLTALSPFYVWYAQEARPYALVLLWSLLAIYALLKMMETGSPVSALGGDTSWLSAWGPKRRIIGVGLYFLALGATLATHYLSFLLLPFHAAALLIYSRRERRWFHGAAWGPQILALLLLGVFGVLFFLLPRSALQVTGGDLGSATFVPFFIILRDLLNSFAEGVTVQLPDVAWLDLTLLALWCIGVASTIRPRRRDYRLALFLLAFVLVPTVALQLGSYLRPLYLNSRHLIMTSPVLYLGIALGVFALVERGGQLRGRMGLLRRVALTGAGIAGVALALGGAAYSLNNLYFNPAYAKDDHKGWAEYLRGRVRPGDLLILDAPQAETIYRYYAPPGLEWISLPNIGLSPAEQDKRDFSAVVNAFRTHPRVWFLELHRPVADPESHIYNLLARWGTWRDVTRFSGTSTEIVLHEIMTDSPILTRPPQIQHPLAITFGDNLQLLGYDAPDQLAAGAHSAIKLYWKLARPSGEDYGVSLRLVDDAGTRWGQWDEAPTGPLTPVTQWPAGSIVLDAHYLPVEPGAPPGRYHLEVSAYHPATHAPLIPKGDGAANDGAAIRLADLTVTRPATPFDPRTLAATRKALPFGDGLALIGYDKDETVSPGDTIALTLYFQLSRNPGHDGSGRVTLAAPAWAFWNRARSDVGFTLPLAGRLPGDVVQVSLEVPTPENAPAGSYLMRLAGAGNWWDNLWGLDEIGTVSIR